MTTAGVRRNVRLAQCGCTFVCADLAHWQYPFIDRDYYEAAGMHLPTSIPRFVSHRVEGVRRHLSAGLIADLGSGMGQTAIALALRGYDVVGVEESRVAIDFLKANCSGIEWHNCRIHDYLREPRIHDGLTLYHVLEHIPEPRALCLLMRERLCAGGLLVIEVPDVEGGQARLRGERWEMYLPDHVNYFSTLTLTRMLEPMGFRLAGRERKYHFAWPTGIWWKDGLHRLLSMAGMHSIITTYWTR